jgi:hypothetical protein
VLACPAMRLVGAYALVATILAVVLAAAILTGPYRAVERSDYMTAHLAARIVLAGDGECLYEVGCQEAVQRQLIGEEPSFSRGALPYNWPPWLAALVAPLGWLSLQAGFAVFTLVSLLLLAWAAWRLAWGGPVTRLLAVVLVLTAWPATMAAIRGQLTLPVAGLLGLSLAASGVGRGSLLGLSTLKLTLVPVVALWLAVRGQWRALAAAAVVTALLVGLAVVVVSPRAVLDYPGHLVRVAQPEALGVHTEEMINWRGAAVRLAAGGWFVAAGTLLTVGALAATWWWSRGSIALGAAAALIATPLITPHANQHEAIVASLGVLMAITALPELRVRLIAAAIGLHAVLWIGPALDAEVSAWLLFVALFAWLGAVAWLAWQRRKR